MENYLPKAMFQFRKQGDKPTLDECFMALAGPPRRYENELPPRPFSHQCVEKLSEEPRERANLLAIRRLIAT
jgi:hypothetical protein